MWRKQDSSGDVDTWQKGAKGAKEGETKRKGAGRSTESAWGRERINRACA